MWWAPLKTPIKKTTNQTEKACEQTTEEKIQIALKNRKTCSAKTNTK